MTHSSVNTMLKNRRYIGELSFRDIVAGCNSGYCSDLFDRVQSVWIRTSVPLPVARQTRNIC